MLGDKGTVGKGQCYGIRIDVTKNRGCAGMDGATSNPTWQELEVRAVKYVPRPVGVSKFVDVYTPKYHFLHDRDLDIIVKVMKANTIRLDPWDINEDHSDFLQLCQDKGLFVIPTFDFKSYAQPTYMATDDDIREQLNKDFGAFLSAVNSTDGGSDNSPILAWSINFALQLNTTVILNQHAADSPSDKLKTYFSRLCMLRHAHQLSEYVPVQVGTDKKATGGFFKRPLAIPIDFTSAEHVSDIGWYLGFTETNWGKWPDCPYWADGPQNFPGPDLTKLRQAGSFDIWIAEDMLLSDIQSRDALMTKLGQLNGTIKDDPQERGVRWPDPTTRTGTDPGDGAIFNGSAAGFSYPTRKAVLMQFGFTSLATIVTQDAVKHETNPDQQQHMIQSFWYAAKNKKLANGKTELLTCASGGIVDEFMDDWDRNAQMNCLSDPYHHAVGEDCATFAHGETAFPEWSGVAGQFSFFTKHCIEARTTSTGAWFSFTCKTETPDPVDAGSLGGLGNCESLAVEFPFPFRGQLKPFRIIMVNWAAGVLLILLVVFFRFLGAILRFLGQLCCSKSRPNTSGAEMMQVGASPGEGADAPLRRTFESSASLADSVIVSAGEEDDDFQPLQTVRTSVSRMERDTRRTEAVGEDSLRLRAQHTPMVEPIIEVQVPQEYLDEDGGSLEPSFRLDSATRRRDSAVSRRDSGAATTTSRITSYGTSNGSPVGAVTKFKLKLDCKSMTGAKAKLFLQAHTDVQGRRLQQQIESEVLALQNRDRSLSRSRTLYAKAVDTVTARAMEGFLVWLESHAWLLSAESRLRDSLYDDKRPTSKRYMDALVLRVIESLSEQIIHAPEFICMMYHKIRWPQRVEDAAAEEVMLFTIDLDKVQEGIDLMNKNGNPYQGGINFDDINDGGVYKRETISKTFKESPSLLVMVDCISNFSPVFTVKMWIFMVAWIFHHKAISKDPTEYRATFVELANQCLLVDCIALMFIEIITFSLGMYQKRCRWRFGYSRWILRRVVYLASALIGIFLSFFQSYSPVPDEYNGYIPFAYWAWRILSFKALTLKNKIPFLSGVPRARGRTKMKKPAIIKFRGLIWLAMLTCCFGFETFLVVPLVSGFQYDDFCSQSCSFNEAPGLYRLLSSCCLACTGAFSFVWLIVALTAFFDIYYFFYLGTAVVGYCMGVTRGLNNILATAQRRADMSSESDAYLKMGGLNRSQAAAELSDGSIMREIFGQSWRMVWSRMAETFYEECIISNEDADRIVQAAGTIRWRDSEKHLTKMVLPTDRFCKLHFIPQQGRNGHGSSFAYAGGPSFAGGSGRGTAPPSRAGTSFGSSFGESHERPWIQSLHVRTHHGAEILDFELNGINPTSQDGFTVTLEPPQLVYEVWFKTAADDASYDPTAWELEGEMPDGKKKVLIVQLESQTMASGTRLPRSVKVGPFPVEPWHVHTGKPSELRLDKLPSVAAERLSFFTVSLRHLHSEGVLPSERLLESHAGSIPSLTQIIPTYSETVINTEKSLKEEDGVQSNLAFIISQYPGEWEFFAIRFGKTATDMYASFIEGVLSAEHVLEVRFWAAMRSQSVARTVAGALRYHEVLSMIPGVDKMTKKPFMEPFSGNAQVGQLIIAHQTFGTTEKDKDKDKVKEENDQSVMQLLEKYKDMPIALVIDFDRQTARKTMCQLVETAFVTKFTSSNKKDLPRYASVMVQFKKTHIRPPGTRLSYQDLQILEILPRKHPLLIGKKPFLTQGKAGNQLNALRFAGGHYIQMMDANMGASFSEACKVPFILKTFQPPSQTDRKLVRFRILGFREFIFTERHGAVGSIMASSESSFGTICQRFLAGLDVRMHYGHPDFIDAFWASNRGSLSKASPAINLSEDIFAGFNARMRGERSEHSDALAWEKGRETSFNTSSMFFTKISSGNVGVMRSRDLKILCERLNIVDNLSFYFASIGFYLNNWLIDISIKVYLFVFVLLTLASKSLEDVGKLGSMLAAEWIFSMGIVATLPRLSELVLEYGMLEGVLKFVPSLPGIMFAFTFINKSIASGVSTAMLTGEAHYIATGRPNANTHFSWRECYFVHCRSHYYPALTLIMWYLIYRSFTTEHQTSALPMFIINLTAFMWLVAPMIFCPQPKFARMQVDMREYWKFVIATPKFPVRKMDVSRGTTENQLNTDFSADKATLYEVWLARALEHKRGSRTLQFCTLVWNGFLLSLLVGLSQVGVFIGLWEFFVAFICHAVFVMIWEAFGRPEALMLFAFLSVFVTPYIFMPDMLFCDYVMALLILVQSLCVIKQAILLPSRMFMRPDLGWTSMPAKEEAEWKRKRRHANRTQRYDILVEYFFINFLEYEIHLLCALLILILNFVTQASMVLLDLACGLHSHFLLNGNLGLRLGACGQRRKFQPGQNASPVSVMASFRGRSFRAQPSARAPPPGSPGPGGGQPPNGGGPSPSPDGASGGGSSGGSGGGSGRGGSAGGPPPGSGGGSSQGGPKGGDGKQGPRPVASFETVKASSSSSVEASISGPPVGSVGSASAATSGSAASSFEVAAQDRISLIKAMASAALAAVPAAHRGRCSITQESKEGMPLQERPALPLPPPCLADAKHDADDEDDRKSPKVRAAVCTPEVAAVSPAGTPPSKSLLYDFTNLSTAISSLVEVRSHDAFLLDVPITAFSTLMAFLGPAEALPYGKSSLHCLEKSGLWFRLRSTRRGLLSEVGTPLSSRPPNMSGGSWRMNSAGTMSFGSECSADVDVFSKFNRRMLPSTLREGHIEEEPSPHRPIRS